MRKIAQTHAAILQAFYQTGMCKIFLFGNDMTNLTSLNTQKYLKEFKYLLKC